MQNKLENNILFITINDKKFLKERDRLNDLLLVESSTDAELNITKKLMEYSLNLSKTATKGVGLIPGQTIEKRTLCWIEGRNKYDLQPVESIDYEWVPEHYSSYVPDLEVRNQHAQNFRQQQIKYDELSLAKKNICADIINSRTEINQIVNIDHECIKAIAGSENYSSTIEIKTLQSLFFLFDFIKKNPNLLKCIEIDLSNNHFNDRDAIKIARKLLSLGRTNVHIKINLANNKIETKGGQTLINLLESKNRPSRLAINLDANNINLPLMSEDEYSLFSAVKANDLQTAKQLLKASEDKKWNSDALNNSPLHYAFLNGNAEMVNLLIDCKFPMDQTNYNGFTPIECCIVWYPETLILESSIVKNIAPLNLITSVVRKIKTDEKDCLHYGALFLNVVSTNCLWAIEICLNADTGINNKFFDPITGNNALHIALRVNPNPEIVNLLLKHNFPLDKKNKAGTTPIQLIAELAYNDTEQNDFALIYAQCLYRYFSIKDESEELKKEIDRFHNHLASKGKKGSEALYFEIANFYFCKFGRTKDDYIKAIVFFTLSFNEDNQVANCKKSCYSELMDLKLSGIDFSKISLAKLKNDNDPETFLKIKESGLIDELESWKGSFAINLELAELYFLLEDYQGIKNCILEDQDNKKIYEFLFNSLNSISKTYIDQCFDNSSDKQEKIAALFSSFNQYADKNQATTELINLTVLTLVALFSDKSTKPLQLSCAQALGFKKPEELKGHLLSLFKRLLDETLITEKKATVVDEALKNIVALINPDAEHLLKPTANQNEKIPHQQPRFFSPDPAKIGQEIDYPIWLIAVFCIPIVGQLGFLLYKLLDYCFPVDIEIPHESSLNQKCL